MEKSEVITMNKGLRIKKLREAKKLTQEEMAKLLNTTKQTISKYEKGIVTNIPSDRIEDMAKLLDSTPEYILGWEKKVEEKPVETANKLADWFLGLEFKEDEDVDLAVMIGEYKQLDDRKQEQVREYVHLLLGKD